MKPVTQTRSQLKREAIIVAAKAAFKEHGVQATSMDKLAELAQVSKRTVYNHFATKEDLVMYLVTDLWQKTLTKIDVVYCSTQCLSTQLQQLISQEIDLISSQEYIDLSRVAIGHLFYHPEILQKEIAKISEHETALQRWLQDAVNDNALNISDVGFAYEQLHNMIKGSCFWPMIFQMKTELSNTDKTQIVEETIKTFLARYAAVQKAVKA